MSADIKDLAVYLGHKGHPKKLSQAAVDDLAASEARLRVAHPEKLLALILEFQRAGLRPIGPALDRAVAEPSRQHAGRMFRRSP